jgi:hypothetical protein
MCRVSGCDNIVAHVIFIRGEMLHHRISVLILTTKLKR